MWWRVWLPHAWVPRCREPDGGSAAAVSSSTAVSKIDGELSECGAAALAGAGLAAAAAGDVSELMVSPTVLSVSP